MTCPHCAPRRLRGPYHDRLDVTLRPDLATYESVGAVLRAFLVSA